jgi:hypothetical protein
MESDRNFSSGRWVGFYNYSRPADRHRMDLFLSFEHGRIQGDGNDDVGAFRISGGYDLDSRECHWTKHYLGAHDVFYKGFGEGKGIWGTWDIGHGNHGGFHIWPRGNEAATEETRACEENEPVEAVGRELLSTGKDGYPGYPGE